MNRDRRSNNMTTSNKRVNPKHRRRPGRAVFRFLVLVAVLGLITVATVLLVTAVTTRGDTTPVSINLSTNPALSPLESIGLGSYLRANEAELNTPVDAAAQAMRFEVVSGQSAGDVANQLSDLGLIDNVTLFLRYARYYGLDTQFEAGTYQVSSAMTIPEIALALTDAASQEVVVQIPEGWRREQIAAWINQQSELPFNGDEFLSLTDNIGEFQETALLAHEIPPGSSLEGFLFPDTYRLSLDATAGDLVGRMVSTFDSRVTSDMRADAANNELSLFDVVIVASIVEREAVVPDERPLIASVYLNRLRGGIKLDADPTVQYAMGYQTDTNQWWNLNLTQADYLSVESPFNTYLYPGLPPGPIANPGLDAIRAVIYPAESEYLFFRAACDGSGRHSFAFTYEEHLDNGCN